MQKEQVAHFAPPEDRAFWSDALCLKKLDLKLFVITAKTGLCPHPNKKLSGGAFCASCNFDTPRDPEFFGIDALRRRLVVGGDYLFESGRPDEDENDKI
jgi:hypothetical protein